MQNTHLQESEVRPTGWTLSYSKHLLAADTQGLTQSLLELCAHEAVDHEVYRAVQNHQEPRQVW